MTLWQNINIIAHNYVVGVNKKFPLTVRCRGVNLPVNTCYSYLPNYMFSSVGVHQQTMYNSNLLVVCPCYIPVCTYGGIDNNILQMVVEQAPVEWSERVNFFCCLHTVHITSFSSFNYSYSKRGLREIGKLTVEKWILEYGHCVDEWCSSSDNAQHCAKNQIYTGVYLVYWNVIHN